jgi:hypothetical protein
VPHGCIVSPQGKGGQPYFSVSPGNALDRAGPQPTALLRSTRRRRYGVPFDRGSGDTRAELIRPGIMPAGARIPGAGVVHRWSGV